MKNHPAISKLLMVFGWLASVGSFAGYVGFRVVSEGTLESNSFVTWGLFLLFIAGTVAATKAFDISKKFNSTNVKKLLSMDPRLPVLYLRSFAADEFTAQLEKVGDNRLVLPTGTDEEALIAVLNWIGPVIAIGRPGERLPTRGAARIYVEDDDWQQVIHDWFASCGLVVLRADSSDGLFWEFSQAINELGPEKIIILVPAIDGVYEAFCDKAGFQLLHKFPKKPPKTKQAGGITGYVWFDKDWIPYFERVGRLEGHRGKALMPAYKPLLGLFLPLIRGQLIKSEYSSSGSEIIEEYAELPLKELSKKPFALRWTLYTVLVSVLVSAPLDIFNISEVIGGVGVTALSALALATAQWFVLSDYLENAKYWLHMSVAGALLAYLPYMYAPTLLYERPFVGSFIYGACYGLAQWLVIRHVSKWSWTWIPVTILGWGLSQWIGGAGAQLLFDTSLPFVVSLILIYALSAMTLGLITGFILSRLFRKTGEVRRY